MTRGVSKAVGLPEGMRFPSQLWRESWLIAALFRPNLFHYKSSERILTSSSNWKLGDARYLTSYQIILHQNEKSETSFLFQANFPVFLKILCYLANSSCDLDEKTKLYFPKEHISPTLNKVETP